MVIQFINSYIKRPDEPQPKFFLIQCCITSQAHLLGLDKQQMHHANSKQIAALRYDPSRKKLVSHGGGYAYKTNYVDTWEFENNKWIEVTDNGTWK